ncbi:hypothetical protein [Cypionkella sp. TWP1-2-1b2]|uniref:hypothetical protein n=1 Tax=Cypionkella sp. TWP1-2-1b2 TaxID=2804675 RepID=UPI003CF929B1
MMIGQAVIAIIAWFACGFVAYFLAKSSVKPFTDSFGFVSLGVMITWFFGRAVLAEIALSTVPGAFPVDATSVSVTMSNTFPEIFGAILLIPFIIICLPKRGKA